MPPHDSRDNPGTPFIHLQSYMVTYLPKLNVYENEDVYKLSMKMTSSWPTSCSAPHRSAWFLSYPPLVWVWAWLHSKLVFSLVWDELLVDEELNGRSHEAAVREAGGTTRVFFLFFPRGISDLADELLVDEELNGRWKCDAAHDASQ